MSPADRLKLLLFLALFSGAVGFLSTLLCCGSEYWLLASESCTRPGEGRGGGTSWTRPARRRGEAGWLVDFEVRSDWLEGHVTRLQ